MGVIELVLIGITIFIIIRLRHVWTNYKIIGQLFDVIGEQAVQDRLFANEANREQIGRTAQQYIFLTRYVPVLVVGMFAVIGTMYVTVASGAGLSVMLSVIGSLVVAGALVWLSNFEPVPLWLYEWHLTVLITRGTIDVEAITSALTMVEQKVEDGEYDNLSDIELEYVNLQIQAMQQAYFDAVTLMNELSQQQDQLLGQKRLYGSRE